MNKKIFVIIAFNLYQFNCGYMQSMLNFAKTMVQKREECAHKLNVTVNKFMNLDFSGQDDNVDDHESCIPLSQLNGFIPEEAHQILHILTQPKVYARNSGYIFHGEPGTGKNTLVFAIAEESGAYVVYHPASEFMDTYIGKGAASVRKLFATAEKLSQSAPVIVFIDEIDTVGTRGDESSTEVASTFNQLLNSMTSVHGMHPIVVIAATNCEDRVDKALYRNGRFKSVKMEMPNKKERMNILSYYGSRYGCSFDANFYETLADKTDGFCCASLEGVFKQAQYLAIQRGVHRIAKYHIHEALSDELVQENKRQVVEKKQHDRESFNREIQERHLEIAERQLDFGAISAFLSLGSALNYIFS